MSSSSSSPSSPSTLPPSFSHNPSTSTLVGYNSHGPALGMPLSSSQAALAGLSDYQYSYPQTTSSGLPKSDFIVSSPKNTFVKTSLKEPRLSLSNDKSSTESSSSTDEEDRRLKESALRKCIPRTQNPLTPPPPSSTGLGIGDSFASSSRGESR